MDINTLHPVIFIGKIVSTSKERLCLHMPQFHHVPSNWDNRGEIKIIPRQYWRRFKLLNWLIPYRVGDRVEFDVLFEKPNQVNSADLNSHGIFEYFAGKPQTQFSANKELAEVRGSIINAEGDVEYSLGFVLYKDQPRHTIFTARAENWDTILSRWSWAIVGAIFTLLCGVLSWLLGLIQLVPVWKIWWP